jgi:hypothetical protein
VLQEREARRQDAGGAALLRRLVRRPWWWLAVAATVAGAVLHVAALALGPLSLVQPFGVLTLMTLAEIPQCCSVKFPTSGLRGMLGR